MFDEFLFDELCSFCSKGKEEESWGVEGGGVLGLIFAGYVPLASQSPSPIIVYSVANYRPHLSHFWAKLCVIFLIQNLVTFYLCIYVILNEKHLTFHQQYKHSGTLIC